jgi:hypothetical protein
MSDYEVTLVNDNSMKIISSHLIHTGSLLTVHSVRIPLLSTISPTHEKHRQEFYVRFKGPEESSSCFSF